MHMGDNASTLYEWAEFYLSAHNSNKAAKLADKLIELRPNSVDAYMVKAKACYRLGKDVEVLKAVNKVLSMDISETEAFYYRIYVLIRNGFVKEAKESMKRLEELGREDELNYLWCRALLEDRENEDKTLAVSLYREVAERISAGEYSDMSATVFFNLAVAESSLKVDGKRVEEEALLPILDRGLSFDRKDIDCLDFKAWLLARINQEDQAIKLYHEEEKLADHGLNVEEQLAKLYYRRIERYAPEAYRYYRYLLERKPDNTDYIFYAGMCKLYMGDYSEAEALFLKEYEMEPDASDAPLRLTFVYEAMADYESALKWADILISAVDKREGNHILEYLRKEQILRRMERPFEAIEIIRYLKERYNYSGWLQRIGDICMQFGLWYKGEENRQEWRRADYSASLLDEIKCMLARGKIQPARVLLKRKAKVLDEYGFYEMRAKFGLIDNKLNPQLRYWNKCLADCFDEDSRTICDSLLQISLAYWRAEDVEQMQLYAELTLDETNMALYGTDNRKMFIRDELFYRTRRAMALALLGSESEANDELQAARKLPICEMCKYSECTDIALFEAYIAALYGDYSKSRKLAQTGIVKWPGEYDFMCHLKMLEKRYTI